MTDPPSHRPRRPRRPRRAAALLLFAALPPCALCRAAPAGPAGTAVQATRTGQGAPAVPASPAAVAGAEAVAAPAAPAAPAVAEAPPLTLDQIMADPDWIGNPPEKPYWAGDGRAVYFERKRQGSPLRDLYRLRLDEREPRLVPDAQRAAAGAPGGAISRHRQSNAYARP